MSTAISAEREHAMAVGDGVAVLRRNSTGEVREHAAYYSGDEGWEFQWTEGNFGCDCNRALFFARAKGEPDPDQECGGEAYTLLELRRPDGSRYCGEEGEGAPDEATGWP